MKKKLLSLWLVLFLAGCGTTSPLRESERYRDPITYSFEAYTPIPEKKDPLEQLIDSVKESSRQIREWENKHLW